MPAPTTTELIIVLHDCIYVEKTYSEEEFATLLFKKLEGFDYWSEKEGDG